MTISEANYTTDGDVVYTMRISQLEIAAHGGRVLAMALEEAAKKVAADYLAQHGSEVLAKISPEAVASMAIAEAGAAVHETLQRKLPDKILEIERRVHDEPVILQRGIFGGVHRLR